jgi:D-tyrosyl-tRNA(Tyr) deacylase
VHQWLILSPVVKHCKWIVCNCIDSLAVNVLRSIPMKALLQRVSGARVVINGQAVGEIKKGLLVFLCAVKGDTDKDLDYIAKKVAQLRIFGDDQNKMNLSVMDIKGEVLAVSQFTLAASTRKGNRPSFDTAEVSERAKVMYDTFVTKLRKTGLSVQTGVFAESMAVTLTNDGPLTILIDSRE